MAVILNSETGELSGEGVTEVRRHLSDLKGVFEDEDARAALPQDALIYRVQAYEPCEEGTPGAVCLATTFLEPGQVSGEYYLTRGHFHANEDRPELEVTLSGEGALVLMNGARETHIEPMRPGSVHPVGPGIAHRVANTGTETLVFVSYWPSETGHDYAAIRSEGFSARVKAVDGAPTLVEKG